MEQTVNQILQPFSVDPCPCGRSEENTYNVCPTCRWESYYDSLDAVARRSVDAYLLSVNSEIRQQRTDRFILEQRFAFIAALATDLAIEANPAGVHRTLRPAYRPDLVDEVKAVVDTHLRGQLEHLKAEQGRKQTLIEKIRVLAGLLDEQACRPVLDEEAHAAYLRMIQQAFEASLDIKDDLEVKRVKA